MSKINFTAMLLSERGHSFPDSGSLWAIVSDEPVKAGDHIVVNNTRHICKYIDANGEIECNNRLLYIKQACFKLIAVSNSAHQSQAIPCAFDAPAAWNKKPIDRLYTKEEVRLSMEYAAQNQPSKESIENYIDNISMYREYKVKLSVYPFSLPLTPIITEGKVEIRHWEILPPKSIIK